MICPKCNHEQEKYGIYKCKSCRMIWLKKWYISNREKINEGSRNWVQNNHEKRKDICRRSDAKHRDKRILYKKKHYLENKEKHKLWASKQTSEQRKEIKKRYLSKLKANKIGSYTREEIFERDNYKCFYCGGAANEIDHKNPISRGGTDSKRNVVACCKSCNKEKHSKTATEYFKYKERLNTKQLPT